MSPACAPRRRWPLLVIGAAAGTAVWSGWVGLGELVGFGVVHPLPGIWDDLTLNTAITLPIGVEAYAVYALSVATTTAPITAAARRFAWISSAAALVLGMAGQVAFHLMAADGLTAAPWPIVAGVSCLPVVVLGVASVLWHLARQDDPATRPADAPLEAPPLVEVDAPPAAVQVEQVERTGAHRSTDLERTSVAALHRPALTAVRSTDAPQCSTGAPAEQDPAWSTAVQAARIALERTGRPISSRAMAEVVRTEHGSCSTRRAGALTRAVRTHLQHLTPEELT